jgi:chemotaxis protein methyltransferase CheR
MEQTNSPVDDEPVLSEADFKRLGKYIQTHFGIRMPAGKRVMLESRLRKRLRRLGLRDFGAYCDRVFGGDQRELVAMIDTVTTNKTDFFREPRHFDYLSSTAVPTLEDQLTAGLRVWSAACSTGEEPWTLAMVLADLSERTSRFKFSILATDLSTEVLAEAKAAVYEEERVEPVAMPFRRKYLLRRKDGASVVRIVPDLRTHVRFDQVNLLEPNFTRFGSMEVIFCRNVFIYFERTVQRDILLRFINTLVPGGYLFLGHSESINGIDVPLTQVAPTVYRKGA